VNEKRKQAVSIRMNAADVRKVKRLADRLGVHDSDVVRFAVKAMLAKLGPLHEADVRGANLVPVFVESGAELVRFFDLDAARLEGIINSGVSAERRVDPEDILLLALHGVQQPYAALKLSELTINGDHDGRASGEAGVSLREYLYSKYLYRGNGSHASNGEEHHADEEVRTHD
jgi:hypothetical protein